MSTDLEAHEPSRRNWLSYSAMTVMTGLNAFNDNFARFMLLPLGGWLVAQGVGFNIEHVLGILMVLPYILFAPSSGWLADRFPKNVVVRWAAWMQLAALGFMCFAMWQRSLPLAVLAFFILALQSALLSPAKAGILKELLGRKKLAFGSGLAEGVTILSVLIGQIVAGILFDRRLVETNEGWSAALPPMMVVFAGCLVAVVLSRLIERTAAHEVGPLTPKVAFRHVRDFQVVWTNRSLKLSALGVAFFWGFATFMLLAVYQVASEMYGGGAGTGTANSLMMATASIGIALGSIAAGFLSRRGTELGLVPVGGLVMTAGAIWLALAPAGLLFSAGLFVAGAGAAIFLVPLKANLIDLSPSDERGKVLSVSNLMNNLAGALAIVLQLVFTLVALPVAFQMAVVALFAGLASWYVMKLLPRQFWYFVGLSLIRSLYRIRVRDAENMPQEGGVILCPNHMTFVDSLVISAASPRPVRFLIAEKCYRHKWVGRFAQMFNAVPVSPERAKEAIRIAAEEVAAGNVVCIFPEGQLSRSGATCEVKRGFEMIARKSKCPVVAAYMHGLWGTFTSFAGGRYFRKWPRRLGSGLTVSFSEPLAPREASAAAVEAAWRKMASESFDAETLDQRTFADPGRFLTEEPASWWQEVHEVGEMNEGEFAKLVRQVQELNAVAFWQRGERVLLEWQPGDAVSRVLGLLLPRIAGVKVALVQKEATEEEILRVSRTERIDRVVLQRKELSAGMLASLRKENNIVQLIADWQGDEVALSQEGIYPSLAHKEGIMTWSMPHPDEKNSPLSTFQAGWKKGSVGRLLPGLSWPEDWEVDEERFLFSSK
jgi:acyl-[acyl-carrier-protein]-phospholipid O-acyltransferase/long-chain-fatty-acid--[acyl-carrier-protein] ligase